MEAESIVQPGAPILQNERPPTPLEGTIERPGRPSDGGGYSTIYKSKWIHDEKESTVCVKCLRMTSSREVPGLTQEERLQRRIRRETLVWGSANHPNIYPYFGYQVVHGETWLISPWTESGSLEAYLEKNRNLDYNDKLKLLKDATQGLYYLHTRTPPIAHGDLSPRNILIRIIDKVATAALSDFGLSRIMIEQGGHTNLTTGAVNGTIGFAARELLIDEKLPTPMSDAYALAGVILFAMSGKKPFYAKTPALATVLIFQNIEPQPQDHPGLPQNDPLWALLHQCWSPVPTNRPTAAQMREKLEEFMAGN